MEKFHIAAFGAPAEKIHPGIKEIASSIDYQIYDVDKLLDPLEKAPQVILCYPPEEKDGISSLEIAQTIRANYPETPMFFIASDKKDFDKKKLIKNGFDSVFLMPWEASDLVKSMQMEAVFTKLPELRNFKAVKVVDLQPGTTLDFSLKIYLPSNNKLLHFSHSGDPIDADKYNRLASGNVNTLFVEKSEVEKFHHYTKETLKKIGKSNALSETEKQDKLEGCIRELISDMFIEDSRENTFGKSQALLKDIKEVINLMIKDVHPNVMSKVANLIHQERSFYVHFTNVSSYAGLFAMVLGLEKPEEVALAGLLHDLGKINLPLEIADLEEDELGPHALEAYHQHPKYSLDIIRLKKITIPESSMKAILQHHECMNGTGYPSKLEGHRITKEARLLAIANTFDHLTSLHPGRPKLSPAEALTQMLDDNTRDPGKVLLDPDMLKILKNFFVEGKNGK